MGEVRALQERLAELERQLASGQQRLEQLSDEQLPAPTPSDEEISWRLKRAAALMMLAFFAPLIGLFVWMLV